MQPSRELLQIAATQRGLLSRDDFDRAAVDRYRLRRMSAAGLVRRIGRQTFEVGGLGPDALRPVLAACMDAGAAASHRTATWLFDLCRQPSQGKPDVIVHRAALPVRTPLATVHSTTNLPPEDLTTVDGIPCTSVARTILTLASMVPEIDVDDVRNVVDDAIRRRLASDKWLWHRLERLRCRGRGGVTVLEAILQERAGGAVTESWLEREFLRILREAGISVPRCQARIAADGAFVARVDFLYPVLDIVIEVTGAIGHATREQRAADARRRNRLAASGKFVLEFTYEQIVGDPAAVVAAVVDAIASRAAGRSGRLVG